MKVLGISGSLRKGSYNTLALRAAQKLVPQGISMEIADISQVPMYNDDVQTAGVPEAVQALREQVRLADAVLLVTPEYNFSIPGVLKNTLDWLSRPPQPPFEGKPVAIMGASPGVVGTARVQYHLRQVLVFMNTFTLNKPEVFINLAATKFNEQGELTDEATRKIIGELLLSLQKLKQRIV
ncbi:NADPH-dependent FMN reductase [Polaromonas sp.]|uniref:NADPH-dependent FMN reductase n=1 Tax=Polaromonas sp. TaxID=1869339 RepID=UPI002FCC4372